MVCVGSAYNIAVLFSVTIDNIVFEMNHQSVLYFVTYIVVTNTGKQIKPERKSFSPVIMSKTTVSKLETGNF